MLSSVHFNDQKRNHTTNLIDGDYLQLFGILHCSGDTNTKAACLVKILEEQSERKVKGEEVIFTSTSTGNLQNVIMKLFAFASTEIFIMASKFGKTDEYDKVDKIYTDKECNELKRTWDTLYQEFVDKVFGEEKNDIYGFKFA